MIGRGLVTGGAFLEHDGDAGLRMGAMTRDEMHAHALIVYDGKNVFGRLVDLEISLACPNTFYMR